MDDLKMSHKLLAVVTDIIKWLRGIYGELCISRGKNEEAQITGHGPQLFHPG